MARTTNICVNCSYQYFIVSMHAEQHYSDVKHAGVSLFMGAGSKALVVMTL